MATRSSLDTKVPPPTPSSPQSPELPNIGSLAVTDVIGSQALHGPEKSSDDAMQTWQRQQMKPAPAAVLSPDRVTTPVADDLGLFDAIGSHTLHGIHKSPAAAIEAVQQQRARPAAAPVLSPSRVNTSVADDLDNLLDETLIETGTRPAAACSSSSTPVQHAAAPSLASFQIEEVEDLEAILAEVASLGFIDIVRALGEVPDEEIARVGYEANRIIGMINRHFKFLLGHAENPGLWLEQESKTPSYRRCHPFAASCFLMTYLPQASSITSHLTPALVAEWKDNYQRCVILLKKHGLDQYNETEFPFSAQFRPVIQQAKMMSGLLAQNPQHVDALKAAVKTVAENPAAIMDIMAKNPQLEEMMAKKMQEMGLDATKLEMMLTSQIQPLLSFFQKLDQVLKKHPQDANAVEAWLKAEASKSTYLVPFHTSHDLLLRLSVAVDSVEKYPANAPELKQIFDDCCRRLIILGLQRYVDEAPPPQKITAFKSSALKQKEPLQRALVCCLAVLRPLSAELKRLPVGAEARNSNRQAIKLWFFDVKARGNYYPPFSASIELYNYRAALEGVLDGAMLQELSVLHPFCRDQLVLLGLDEFLDERPDMSSPETAKPAAAPAAAPAPKRELSNSERFTRELAFFREMIKIDDKAVDQWLKDNSPKLDYPLLWAKKRMSQFSSFRDSVSLDLRSNWRTFAETSLEKVPNTAHVDLGQIPDDASPELLAFLRT